MGAVEIANALAASRKAVRLYPPQHPTHREAVGLLVSAVNDAVDVRPLVLNLSEGRLYEASEVLTDASPATRALTEAMELRRVESLTFHMGFNDNDATGVSEVLGMRPSPELQVAVELEERDVRGVTVSELEDRSAIEAEERDRKREADRSLYRQSLTALKRITEALESGEPAESVEASRVIALVIERVTEEPESMLGLAMMTGHGEAWRFHAVSVMLRSLVIGHLLGLSDRELLAIGLAALVHDLGSVLDPDADPDQASADHSITGAHALGALDDEDCTTMIVAYEHHVGVDGSGWPDLAEGSSIHPYTRIVAVADHYENAVRPTRHAPLRPDQALAQLLEEASGGPLDPVAARVFAQAIGVIPIGSAVRLTDHSVALVRAPGRDPLYPQVRVVLAPDGTELRPAPDIDLVEEEREIVEVIAADLLDLVPADHL